MIARRQAFDGGDLLAGDADTGVTQARADWPFDVHRAGAALRDAAAVLVPVSPSLHRGAPRAAAYRRAARA